MENELARVNVASLPELVTHIRRAYRQDPVGVFAVFEKMTAQERLEYHEITYWAAHYKVASGQYPFAEQIIATLLPLYEQPDNQYNLNRLRMLHLHIAYEQQQMQRCQQIVDAILASSEDDIHIVAATRYLAQIEQSQGNIDSALDKFIDVYHRLKQATFDMQRPPDQREMIRYDQLQVAQLIAQLAMENGLVEINDIYHQESLAISTALAQKDEATFHVINNLIADAERSRVGGDLQSALDACHRAENLAKEKQIAADHVWLQANEIRLQLGQDSRLHPILSDNMSARAIAQWLCQCAERAVFNGDRAGAQRALRQLQFVGELPRRIRLRQKMIEVALACIDNHLDGVVYQSTLEDAIQYFEERGQKQDASLAKFVLAWALRVDNNHPAAVYWANEFVKDIRQIGHVTHVWRWYLSAMAPMTHLLAASSGGNEIVLKMREFMNDGMQVHQHQNARIRLFGRSELWLDGVNHLEHTRATSRNIPLLLMFLMEQNNHPLDIVIDQIWGNVTARNIQSFHSMRYNQPAIQELIAFDGHSYSLKRERIDYADVSYAKHLFLRAHEETEPETKIFLWMVALSVSARQLAPRIENDYVDSVREYFRYMRARAILDIQDLQKQLRQDMAMMQLSPDLILEAQQTMQEIPRH